MLALAAKARFARRVKAAGTALPSCIQRRRASAASTSASFRARAALTPAPWRKPARSTSSINLGADEIDIAPGAFVIYQGSHGDRGAERADVILPGAAYTEKPGLYVNTEGRVQLADRANFPAGRRPRGLGDPARPVRSAGTSLPFDSLTALRGKLFAAHPHFAATRRDRRRRALRHRRADRGGRRLRKRAFRVAASTTYYLTNPIARASAVMAECSALRHDLAPPGRGVGRWQNTGWLLPLLITVVKSVALLVVLLIFIAYILYADRKIWAAVQLRRGPNVVGPWGLLQSFADMLKFVFKEPVIPDGANKGIFLLAPLVTGPARAGRLGGHPGRRRLGHRQHQCRHSLHFRDLLARRLWHHHGRLGLELEISVPLRAALGGADGLLRSLDRLRHHHRAALRRLAQPHRHREGAGHAAAGLLGWYWLPLFPMFVIFFISALAETNRPPFDLVEAESELVAGFMVEYSATPYMLFMLAEYVAIITMCALMTILFLGGWLSPIPFAPFTWVPGVDLVRPEGLRGFLHDRHGESLRAALSLRPADAARLEGLPADLARHGGARRRGAATHRLGRGDGTMTRD